MQSLVADIHAGFGLGTPPPRPVTPHRCEECDEVDECIGGKTWLELAANFPAYCVDAYPLLTLASKIYYLPAYMCFEINEPGCIVGISLSGALERSELAPAQFNEAQQHLIGRWIAHYFESEREPVPDKFAKYWPVQ